MRIAVFGTGAVGGYFGGRLAEAGEDVVFLARGAHLAAIRANGLRVTSVAGDFVIRPTHATDDPATVGPVDGILLGVKAWQVADAAVAIRPMVGPDTFVLPLQNGVEAPGILADVLGAEHVLGGLCRILVYVVEPGHIRHQGVEPDIAFGELNGTRTDRVEALRRAFAKARGVTVTIPPDIRAALWSKFLFIATLSGLGALTRVPIGVIRSLPGTRRMLEQGLREIELVARARGVTLAPDVVSKTLAFIDSLPPDATASMQRDIMEGRPSELESQNGAVVRLGQQAGVDVSLHRFIYHALLPLERKARGEVQ
ncbi:MAG TPA: 2-dehydropantoate 2-reductase [Gemmatimonadales bacterium]|jgi:2-dehydropantoate 2-reductase